MWKAEIVTNNCDLEQHQSALNNTLKNIFLQTIVHQVQMSATRFLMPESVLNKLNKSFSWINLCYSHQTATQIWHIWISTHHRIDPTSVTRVADLRLQPDTSWLERFETSFFIFVSLMLFSWFHTKTDFLLLKPGPRLNIKTVLSTYGDFHVKDKTAVRTSYL